MSRAAKACVYYRLRKDDPLPSQRLAARLKQLDDLVIAELTPSTTQAESHLRNNLQRMGPISFSQPKMLSVSFSSPPSNSSSPVRYFIARSTSQYYVGDMMTSQCDKEVVNSYWVVQYDCKLAMQVFDGG